MDKTKIVMAWSGGKDSAMALYRLLRDARYEVAGLLTTVTSGYERISMHGVRIALLDRQAAATGLPLTKVVIPPACSNETYEANMAAALEKLKAQGVSGVAFGDIFLEDLRKYREEKLAGAGLVGVFPLWKEPTPQLAQEFLRLGFATILTCVDSRQLDGRFAGRDFDQRLLDELPAGVDPCGENGEFHSFVHAGPIFSAPIRVQRGEVVVREDRFWFCDVLESADEHE